MSEKFTPRLQPNAPTPEQLATADRHLGDSKFEISDFGQTSSDYRIQPHKERPFVDPTSTFGDLEQDSVIGKILTADPLDNANRIKKAANDETAIAGLRVTEQLSKVDIPTDELELADHYDPNKKSPIIQTPQRIFSGRLDEEPLSERFSPASIERRRAELALAKGNRGFFKTLKGAFGKIFGK